MINIIVTELSPEEIARIFVEEFIEAMEPFIATKLKALEAKLEALNEQDKSDIIGGIDLATVVTGYAKPTIYGLVSDRKIPHAKRGKKLYFSRDDLYQWISQGDRTQREENNDSEPAPVMENVFPALLCSNEDH